MAQPLYANHVAGLLAATIGPSDTAVLLGAGQGAIFPAITAGNWYYCVLVHNVTGVTEVVKVVAKSVDTLTVVRGQDGSSATSFATGSVIELRVVAQTLREIDYRSAMGLAGGLATLEVGTGRLPVAQLPSNVPLMTGGKIDMANIPDAVATDAELAGKANLSGANFTGPVTFAGNVTVDTGGAGAATLAVGNDAYFVDCNIGNTLSLRGVANAALGWLQFGTGPRLGWDGSSLVWNGSGVWYAGNFDPNSKLNVTSPSVNGNLTGNGRFFANTYFSSTVSAAVLSAEGGVIYLRPNGADNNTNATMIHTSGLLQAVDVQSYSDKRFKKKIRAAFADITLPFQLQLKVWKRKADNADGWGLVAQDLLEKKFDRHVGGTLEDGYSVDYGKVALEVAMANHLRLCRIEAALNLKVT
jgi:hypothetical protein